MVKTGPSTNQTLFYETVFITATGERVPQEDGEPQYAPTDVELRAMLRGARRSAIPQCGRVGAVDRSSLMRSSQRAAAAGSEHDEYQSDYAELHVHRTRSVHPTVHRCTPSGTETSVTLSQSRRFSWTVGDVSG